MASQKTNLKKHIEYLFARRSGAEWCLDLIEEEQGRTKIKGFIRNLSTSLQEHQSKLSTIEKEEAEVKAAEKQKLEDARKSRDMA
jgi:predicted metal-dependent hydrolase